MALFNYATREINAKIVYYGIGLSGKTTNIQKVYEKLAPQGKGKLVTVPTKGDRTIFLDFLPFDAGEINGFKLRFHLYTVPGQVFYSSTRKLVLKGADGVVFVADSQRDAIQSNIQSIEDLRENLLDEGIHLDHFPFVLQYNKRDLPNVLSIQELNEQINPNSVPVCEATAVSGEGVVETLKAIGKVVVKDLKRSFSKKAGRSPAPQEHPVKEPLKEVPKPVAADMGAQVSQEISQSELTSHLEPTMVSSPPADPVSVQVQTQAEVSVPSLGNNGEEASLPAPVVLKISLEIELENDQGIWKTKSVRVKE